jgi:hypothetical protein
MDAGDVDPVVIIGVLFILGGIGAMALGHLTGGLIVIGVGALILGLGGEGEASGAGITVSGAPGLVIIGIGVIVYFLTGQTL